MRPQKSDSTVDKNTEDRLKDVSTGIEHLREFPMNPISHHSQGSDELHTGEDNEQTTLLRSAVHFDLEEEEEVKHKLSWIELLKARLKSLFNSSIFLATLSSLTITMNSFVVKILARDYSVFQIVSVRGAIGLLILLSFMFWRGIYPLGARHKVPPLIMRGILGATAIISSWIAIDLLPLSEASFLWNSYPIVTAVLASLIGMEKLNWMTWLGIAGTAVGNALVAHPPFIFGGHQDWGATRGVGLALSTLSVLAMGSTFIVVKMIGKNVHPFVHSTYQFSCSVLISAPFLGASYPDKIKLPDGVLDSGLFLVVSLGSIMGQGFSVAALQRGSPTAVTAVLMTNMIYSGILGMLVLSERFSLVSGSGAFIILISVFLVIFGRGLSKKQEQKTPLQNEGENELELDLVPNDFNRTNEEVEEST